MREKNASSSLPRRRSGAHEQQPDSARHACVSSSSVRVRPSGTSGSETTARWGRPHPYGRIASKEMTARPHQQRVRRHVALALAQPLEVGGPAVVLNDPDAEVAQVGGGAARLEDVRVEEGGTPQE
eukprot:scaffold19867_cov56-Phaeocystis_antarctica.AAC.8